MDFKFNHVLLGNIPPRIGGVKCYDKTATARNEIILDLDVTWAGDCDIQVGIKKMSASVLDLYIHGHLRVVLKPLIHHMPLFGGIQVRYFNSKLDQLFTDISVIIILPGEF